MSALANFLKMLDAGKDGALLRYSLGNEYAKLGDAVQAVLHLRQAVTLDSVRVVERADDPGKAALVVGVDGGGRHLAYPTKQVPTGNLLLSILDQFDIQRDSFGDSTGRLPGLV